jgi:hypothetical protein
LHRGQAGRLRIRCRRQRSDARSAGDARRTQQNLRETMSDANCHVEAEPPVQISMEVAVDADMTVQRTTRDRVRSNRVRRECALIALRSSVRARTDVAGFRLLFRRLEDLWPKRSAWSTDPIL